MTDRLNPEVLDQQALEAACKTLWESAGNYPRRWEDVSPAVQEGSRRTMRKFTAAYLAALPAPRTITTVEELGALPTSAYVEDMHGDRGIVFNEHIWYPETKPLLIGYALKHYGPFTVLWVPTEGGGA